MAYVRLDKTPFYIGASGDTQPATTTVGARCYEYDTKKWYITHDGGTTWTEMQDLDAIVLGASTAVVGRTLPLATVETPFTGAGNLVVGTNKITPGAAFKLTEIELHLSTAPTSGTQNLVITKDDGVATAYDVVILTIDLVANAVTDLVIKPNKSCKSTDVITAAWTNTNTVTYGLIFKHQLI